jgi:hypothetical protein
MSSPAEEALHREAVALRAISDAVRGLRFGTVNVLVQDGVVIQIDRTEKVRLDYARESAHFDGGGI